MRTFFIYLIVFLCFISCTEESREKETVDTRPSIQRQAIKKDSVINERIGPSEEWKNSRLYDFKVYQQKNSIDLKESVETSYGEEIAKTGDPKAFLYKDSKDQIRISTYLNKLWYTWTIHDANNEEYSAKLEKKNFDNIGNREILIQSKYGLAPQSTFGNSYYGDFQIWNIDSIALYFDISNYEYSDDMGRNGDQSYTKECFLNVEVNEKQLKVSPEIMDKDCSFDNQLTGVYLLENGEVIKFEK